MRMSVFIHVCAYFRMLRDGMLLSQTLFWPSAREDEHKAAPPPPPNLKVLEVPAGAEELRLGD